MQRLRAEIKIAKDVKKDRRIISRARVITGAEALEAMRKADMKKKGSAETSRSKPTTPHCTPQQHSTPSTCSTIHVTPFTPRRVRFNLSTVRAQPSSLPRLLQYSKTPAEWDSDTSSEDDGSANSHETDTEESSYSRDASATSTGDLQPISERLHQMSLRTHRR
ncbi:hypothetical protein L873DRAFT_1806261 [Choiromyces venosus 120613-1]|uniref:Uncharacterized protein n=1 Tax=Choiromyces venosus 120613-1 TaxID=1336337 RepID=A0A3N4JNC1_9PEZI|nr:hypothetical protein L873DRAFT_1806261 [Choiromyces venosus 120613-1]